MSTAGSRPTARPRPTGRDPRRPRTLPDPGPLLGAAVRAVLSLLVPVLLLCIVGWIASVRSTSSLAAVARVGADLWLLAHGADVAIVGGTLGVAPLGVTLLAGLSARRAVRMWLADQAESERPAPFGPALGMFTAAYGLLTLLVALVARSGVGAASPASALLGGCLVGGLGALAALWPLRPATPAAVPAWLAAAWRPAAAAVLGLAAVGSLVVAAALLHGRDDVLALHRALTPGLVGGALLTLAQALLLPTLAVWGVAWTSGTGFAVGTGTSVAPGGTSLDVLPTVPVLGALPAPGATPALAWAAVAAPVLVGALAQVLAARRGRRVEGLLHRCATALVQGALTGAGVALLSALASGALGHGRLGQVGPDALLTGAVVAGEVAAGAVLAVLLGRAWRAWRGAELVIDLPGAAAGAPGTPRKLLGDDRPTP
ncbi:cell division protein PerM [Kineococcus sp. SYSU DK002]|uniref:cell division protein PerM n=1 Tax=Kineococcus sp. SYSU DK002 TaxID=3383123 RepID=UPI003D7E3577